MQLFVSFVACAFLAVNVQSTKETFSQQTCKVGKVCGVLENVVRKQGYLEKKVAEHSKILGGQKSCEGKIAVKFMIFVLLKRKKQPKFCLVLVEMYALIMTFVEGGTPVQI